MTDDSNDVVHAREKLQSLAEELGTLSKGLAHVSRELEPLEKEFQEFADNFELGLWQRSLDEEKFKLPSEKLRERMVRRSFATEHPEKMGQLLAYQSKQTRMEKRIRDIGKEADSQRSILSALKVEMDAGGSGSGPTYERPIGGQRR